MHLFHLRARAYHEGLFPKKKEIHNQSKDHMPALPSLLLIQQMSQAHFISTDKEVTGEENIKRNLHASSFSCWAYLCDFFRGSPETPNKQPHSYKYILLLLLVAKSCPTLATPWTVAHQAALSMAFRRRILQRVAISYSWESSLPRDQTRVSCIGWRALYH